MRALRLVPVLVLALLAGCGGLGKDGDPAMITSANLDKLADHEWLLKTITVDGQRVIMHVDATQTIRFGSDGRVTGYAGVNRFAGAYTLSPQGLLAWPGAGLIATRMAGPPELMEKEQAFLRGLPKTARAIVAGKALQLQSDDGSTVLLFERIGS